MGLIAVLPLAFRLDKEIRAAERTSVEQDLSPRVQIWIKSVDCALRTGTFLTVCGGDGKIHPIEDASPADDRGHVLLLTLQAMMTGKIPSAVDIVKMNLALNSIALLLAGLACLYSGWRVAAFVVVFLGARSVIPGFRGPEIAASFAGLYCLMVAAGILMSDLLEDGGRSRRVTIAALSCVMLLIGFISLLRQPLGIAAALLCSALLLIKGRGLAWGSKRSLGLLAALLLGPWVACRSPHFMTSMRDILFDAPKAAHGIPAHGLGHALLLGLGEESNPFGIRWEDAYGEELVKRERPEIEYLSAEYFRFAWIRYLGIVFGSPIIVSKIYIEKTRKALETMAMGWGGFATLSLWLGYFGASRFGRPGHAEGPRMDACLVFGISATLILLQGVLGWPYPIYIYPCFMGFMFYRLCLALTAWSLRKHELAICALLWAILNLCWGFVRSVEAVFGPGGIKFLEGSNLVLETAFMVLSLLALRGDRSFGPKMEMRLGR